MGLYDSNNMSSSEAKLAYEWSEEQHLLREAKSKKKEFAESKCELCGSKIICIKCLGLTKKGE